VNALSENVKLRLDTFHEKMEHPPESAVPSEPSHLDDAEAQMRRALGLNGGFNRPKPEPERAEPAQRSAERFGFNSHRRRFVQDGDIPVTVVRRDGPAEHSGPRATTPAPASNRLQRIEGQLAVEAAARATAERALAEAQAAVRDLQTKLGHAELAKHEALEQTRREREATAALRASANEQAVLRQEAEERAQKAEQTAHTLQLDLSNERTARRAAEKALRAAEDAQTAAEALVRELSDQSSTVPEPVAPVSRRAPSIAAAASPSRRKPVPVTEAEPEPVKWWLNTKPGSTRRR